MQLQTWIQGLQGKVPGMAGMLGWPPMVRSRRELVVSACDAKRFWPRWEVQNQQL